MVLNWAVGEDSWESTGLQGDQTANWKEINPEYSLEGLMLKRKLRYFGLMQRGQLTGKDPDAGKDWRQKEKGAVENEMVR